MSKININSKGNAIEIGEVNFSSLHEHDDATSAVLIGTTFPYGFDFAEVDTFLSDGMGFSRDKALTGVYRIMGNVLGADGRTDWLLTFDNPQKMFNPIARLRFPDLKWTSDFIDNYGGNYGHPRHNDFDD